MESKCIEYSWGKEWRNSNRQLHRENDLPAVENNDGYKSWYINGECHREIGPAIIRPSGIDSWYLNGIRYYPKEMPINLYINYLKWEYKKKNEQKTV